MIEGLFLRLIDEDSFAAFDLALCMDQSRKGSFDLVGEVHAEVGVRGFLESTKTEVAIFAVHGSSHPAKIKVSVKIHVRSSWHSPNVVALVPCDALTCSLRVTVEQIAKTIIRNEDVGLATLQLVFRDRGHQASHCWDDDQLH
jgi:hypothetical protein